MEILSYAVNKKVNVIIVVKVNIGTHARCKI